MEILAGERFEALFSHFTHEAFHLELRDSYDTPEEHGPFQLFLDGKPDNYEWFEPWLSLVRNVHARGKRVTRGRVVTVPHCDYTRWGLQVASQNIAAGEEIRWLPRHLADGIAFPQEDFWLFDDKHLVNTVFADDGTWLGGVEITDAALIEQCRAVKQQVWRRAIPHEEYLASEYVGV